MSSTTEEKYKQILDWCLKNANITKAKDKQDLNKSLIHVASEMGVREFVAKLLQEEMDIDIEDSQKQTPLHYASMNGNSKMAEFLIHKGANVNYKSDHDWTPIHFIANGFTKWSQRCRAITFGKRGLCELP